MVTETHRQWFGYWRATKTPAVPLPCGARSVGRADVKPGWRHGRGQIHWTNLYWGEWGEVGLVADGARCRVPAEHIVVHPPETQIDGYPVERAGRYRWLTLDGPLVTETLQHFGLPWARPLHAGPCPVTLFDALEGEVQKVTQEGEYRAAAIAYTILTRAGLGISALPVPEDIDPRVKAALAIMAREFASADLTVAGIARQIGTHRSVLSRAFRREMGLSPSSHLQRLRLQEAMKRLRDTRQTIREIAFACGFTDPAYFSRVVQRHMRQSPQEVRRSF